MNSKGELQEHCQKHSKAVPVYSSVQTDGQFQLPFQSMVTADGKQYIGEPCSTKKEAEKSAASKAMSEIRGGNAPPELSAAMKSTLQEICVQRFKTPPVYETQQTGVSTNRAPKFFSVCRIGDQTYTSRVCSNKKDAESDAARIALSQIEQSEVKDGQKHIESEAIDSSYKVRLFEYCQKNRLPMPDIAEAEMLKDGIKNFTCVVTVEGRQYHSAGTHFKKANATYSACKAALDEITDPQQTPGSGKSMLQMYIQKLKPNARITYQHSARGLPNNQHWIASVNVDGREFKSEKSFPKIAQAEDDIARIAFQTLSGATSEPNNDHADNNQKSQVNQSSNRSGRSPLPQTLPQKRLEIQEKAMEGFIKQENLEQKMPTPIHELESQDNSAKRRGVMNHLIGFQNCQNAGLTEDNQIEYLRQQALQVQQALEAALAKKAQQTQQQQMWQQQAPQQAPQQVQQQMPQPAQQQMWQQQAPQQIQQQAQMWQQQAPQVQQIQQQAPQDFLLTPEQFFQPAQPIQNNQQSVRREPQGPEKIYPTECEVDMAALMFISK